MEDSALWVPGVVFDRLVKDQNMRRHEVGDKSYRLTRNEIERITDEYVVERTMRQRELTQFVVEEAATVIRDIEPAQLRELGRNLLNNQKLQALLG